MPLIPQHVKKSSAYQKMFKKKAFVDIIKNCFNIMTYPKDVLKKYLDRLKQVKKSIEKYKKVPNCHYIQNSSKNSWGFCDMTAVSYTFIYFTLVKQINGLQVKHFDFTKPLFLYILILDLFHILFFNTDQSFTNSKSSLYTFKVTQLIIYC